MKTYKAEDYLLPGLNIHIFKARNKTAALHLHNFLEIVYILEGSGVECINSVKYPVSAGNMLFINYNSTHSFYAKDKLTYINIILKPETIGENIITAQNAFDLLSLTAFDKLADSDNSGVVMFKGAQREEIESILSGMLCEIKERRTGYGEVLDNYANIVFTKLIRKMSVAIENDKHTDVWSDIIEYIDEHLNESLTLNELASKCFYNPSYFSRVFREKYGITLVEYIINKRCAMAAELLTSTTLATGYIADRCGFGSKTAFYRNFQRIYGCTPSSYRKM